MTPAARLRILKQLDICRLARSGVHRINEPPDQGSGTAARRIVGGWASPRPDAPASAIHPPPQRGQRPLIRKSTSWLVKPAGSLTRRGIGISVKQVTESQRTHWKWACS